MAFIPVPDTCLVEMRYTCAGERVENTLWFNKAGGWSPTWLDTLGNALLSWWQTSLQPLQVATCSLREIYLRDMETAGSWAVTVTPPGAGTGSASGEGLPNNATLCISFRTNRAGRSWRGRNYSIGMSETHQANSYATNFYATSLIDAYEAMAAAALEFDMAHVIVSRFANNAPRVQGVPQTVLNYSILDLGMDSQRRRLPGRGQ